MSLQTSERMSTSTRTDVRANIYQNIRADNGNVLSDVCNDIQPDVLKNVCSDVHVNASDVRANMYQNIRALKGNNVSDVPNDIQADVSRKFCSDVHVSATDVRANIEHNIVRKQRPRFLGRPSRHPSRCLGYCPNGCPRERH